MQIVFENGELLMREITTKKAPAESIAVLVGRKTHIVDRYEQSFLVMKTTERNELEVNAVGSVVIDEDFGRKYQIAPGDSIVFSEEKIPQNALLEAVESARKSGLKEGERMRVDVREKKTGIRAGDLQLFDLIHVKGYINADMQVAGLGRKDVNVQYDANNILSPETVFVPIREVEPIALTPDILLNLGFKSVGDHTLRGCETYQLSNIGTYEARITIKLTNGYIRIATFDGAYYTMLERYGEPEYVHELQHILRDSRCGLETFANTLKIRR